MPTQRNSLNALAAAVGAMDAQSRVSAEALRRLGASFAEVEHLLPVPVRNVTYRGSADVSLCGTPLGEVQIELTEVRVEQPTDYLRELEKLTTEEERLRFREALAALVERQALAKGPDERDRLAAAAAAIRGGVAPQSQSRYRWFEQLREEAKRPVPKSPRAIRIRDEEE